MLSWCSLTFDKTIKVWVKRKIDVSDTQSVALLLTASPMLDCSTSSGPSDAAPSSDSLMMSVKTSSFYKNANSKSRNVKIRTSELPKRLKVTERISACEYISFANLEESPRHHAAIRRHRTEIVVVVHVIALPAHLNEIRQNNVMHSNTEENTKLSSPEWSTSRPLLRGFVLCAFITAPCRKQTPLNLNAPGL